MRVTKPPISKGGFALTQTAVPDQSGTQPAPASARPAGAAHHDPERTVRTTLVGLADREAAGQGAYRVTIAANDKARQPPELDLSGISTENYFRNPVVMWAHDLTGRSPSGGLPIGRTLALDWVQGRGLVARFEFLDDDPFAQRVRNAWEKGFLRAASISWVPLESGRADDGGRRDTRADLLEWSIVPVPADPEALRHSHRLMLDAFLSDPQPDEELIEALDLLTELSHKMRHGSPPLP